MSEKNIVNGRVHCPAELAEQEYNLQAAFPDYPQVRQGWHEKGALLRQERKLIANLCYGDQPLQTLDFFQVEEAHRPLMLIIHGGYWQGGDKADVCFLARPFIDANINVALLNYSLAPASPIEDMVAEMRQAYQWLLARAAQYQFNPGAVSVMGHSAGGHLATSLASYAAASSNEVPSFRHVFSVSGVHDLPPLLPASTNRALGLDMARADALSPVTLDAPGNTEVYTLVGQLETSQFHAQSLVLHQAWPQQVKAHYEVAGTDHFTILDVLGDATTADCQRVLQPLLA